MALLANLKILPQLLSAYGQKWTLDTHLVHLYITFKHDFLP